MNSNTPYSAVESVPHASISSLLLASLDAMLIAAPDGNILAANRAASELFGYTMKSSPGCAVKPSLTRLIHGWRHCRPGATWMAQ